MKHFWLTSIVLGGMITLAGPAGAAEKSPSFGALELTEPAVARTRVQTWLKEVGKTDAEINQKIDAIFKQEAQSLIDQVADAIALGNADAARLLAEARDPSVPAPVQVDSFFKNDKISTFARSQVALAYARALSGRKVYEESLDVLKVFNPEQTIDPAAYLFHRAVCEHALLRRPEATRSISRLLDEAVTIMPERYKAVSALMLLDMQTWKEKDLADIARKMENIERRLELSRGGPETQKQQKEVVARLDELIKKLENKSKSGSGSGSCPNGGGCPGSQPGSGPPQGNNPSSPATESGIANAGGSGNVDPLKVKKLTEEWGRLTPREQGRLLTELTQGMSPRHREAIENYFRNLAQVQTKR